MQINAQLKNSMIAAGRDLKVDLAEANQVARDAKAGDHFINSDERQALRKLRDGVFTVNEGQVQCDAAAKALLSWETMNAAIGSAGLDYNVTAGEAQTLLREARSGADGIDATETAMLRKLLDGQFTRNNGRVVTMDPAASNAIADALK